MNYMPFILIHKITELYTLTVTYTYAYYARSQYRTSIIRVYACYTKSLSSVRRHASIDDVPKRSSKRIGRFSQFFHFCCNLLLEHITHTKYCVRNAYCDNRYTLRVYI